MKDEAINSKFTERFKVTEDLNLTEVYYEKEVCFWDTLFHVTVFMCLCD